MLERITRCARDPLSSLLQVRNHNGSPWLPFLLFPFTSDTQASLVSFVNEKTTALLLWFLT